MYEGPINVRYDPDHEAPTFDESGTPFLTWQEKYPVGGARHDGWVLWYLDDSDGVEGYFIPGDITDQDDAMSAARAWLGRFTVEDA